MTIKQALILDGSKTNQVIGSRLLKDLNIDADTASDEADAWRLIKARERPFDLILVARSVLEGERASFVSRLRASPYYSSVPLILLVGDKTDEREVEYLYGAGFTQIFSRTEYNLLQDYIKQSQGRNTFEKDRNNKVIIIEDDLSQQLMVQSILEENHCECFCFSSAEEALSHAADIQPHVITCDFFLEGNMTGMDLILLIQHDDHPWYRVPIMVMTGMDDTARKYELVRSGANDYITKPIDGLDLTVRVENLIRYKHLLDTVEQQKQEMQHLAMHDQLTGLYNRHFVAEQVNIGIVEAQRHKSSYSLIILDIDFFKLVNDKHGHDVGDEVLQSVGSFLQRQVRSNDVVARMGGEEFLMLMAHCNITEATEKAESLRSGLEVMRPAGLVVTASFGVAQLTKTLDSFDKLFKAADLAIYRAKEQGRNRVEVAKDEI
jgi:two-component system cell cycle response regulator